MAAHDKGLELVCGFSADIPDTVVGDPYAAAAGYDQPDFERYQVYEPRGSYGGRQRGIDQ